MAERLHSLLGSTRPLPKYVITIHITSFKLSNYIIDLGHLTCIFQNYFQLSYSNMVTLFVSHLLQFCIKLYKNINYENYLIFKFEQNCVIQNNIFMGAMKYV